MNDCVFCRIVAGDIPAKVVARSADAVAFHDLSPQAPVHVLVVPVLHVQSAAHATNDDASNALDATVRLAVDVARQLGLDVSGYRLVTNVGADGGQSVGHLHVHVLGGRQMKWPPG